MSSTESKIDYWTRQILKGLASIVILLVGALSYSQNEKYDVQAAKTDALIIKVDAYIRDQTRLEGKVNMHEYRLNRNESVISAEHGRK